MATITAIKPQRRRQRFNIFLDNRYAFALSAEALVKAGLKMGQEFSASEIREFKKGDTAEKLYDKTLRFLSYRPRSEKEIKDYLKKKEATPKISAKIINSLKKQKLLDDKAFAVWWVKQRVRFRPKGRRTIWWELKQKGISEEIINDSLFSEKKN